MKQFQGHTELKNSFTVTSGKGDIRYGSQNSTYTDIVPHVLLRLYNPKLEAQKKMPHLGYCLSNSWIIHIIWLYIALNRTPNIDCYWVGAVPNLHP